MVTEQKIRARIKEIEKAYSHILTGTFSTIVENAPRALMQLRTESKLEELYLLLGEIYHSKLKR